MVINKIFISNFNSVSDVLVFEFWTFVEENGREVLLIQMIANKTIKEYPGAY